MERVTQFGRILYAIAMGFVGIQQLCYGDFVAMIAPAWPTAFIGLRLLAVLISIFFILAAFAIIANKRARQASLILGFVLLLLTLFSQIPYLYLVFPHKKTHLGVWSFVLKDLALSGGAFLVARSFAKEKFHSGFYTFLERLVPLGRFFFATTMICFGCAHYAYAEGMTALVPSWIPGSLFWVYCTGTALIAAGIAIATKLLIGPAAFLLGCTIFIWFWIIHLPNTIRQFSDPGGNQITAALSAIAFCGTAFVIAGLYGWQASKKTANKIALE